MPSSISRKPHILPTAGILDVGVTMPSTPKTAIKKPSAKKTAKKAAKKSPAKKQSAGELSTPRRNSLSGNTFAFPNERKEPLNNASHVRNAIARFDQTKAVSDSERDTAFKKIKAAARKYGIELPETSWRDLGRKPHTRNPASK